MSIFPANSNLMITVNSDNISPYNPYKVEKLKEYAWDFENNKFILEDGKFVIVQDLEALKIRIYKKLKTPKGKKNLLMVYSKDYGINLDDEIIDKILTEEVKDKIKQLINECLIDNNYVTGITYNNFLLNGDRINVDMTISTKYGPLNMEV